MTDKNLRAQPQAREDAQPVWVDGVPTKHHAKEWFIADTTFGDRVVLTALPEEYAYDFKTADETYIKADRIKRWMPFPDSQYLFPHPAPDALRQEVERLRAALNTPEVDDFAKAVVLEAQHQRERWPSEHDAGKTPLDWFWLVGYLAQKAATAQIAGDDYKAKHHTISTAAALANWHAAISGDHTAMRPGIAPPATESPAVLQAEQKGGA